jgi:hypothetical protein
MTHPEEIEKFNKICEGTEGVFLDGLEDPLGRVRADVVYITLFLYVEQAYARVKQEAT